VAIIERLATQSADGFIHGDATMVEDFLELGGAAM
jgi:hypothetical protein